MNSVIYLINMNNCLNLQRTSFLINKIKFLLYIYYTSILLKKHPLLYS